MTNPVVATVLRSGHPESLHRGFGAIANPDGKVLFSFGDPETPVYWRSTAKPFQILPFLEAGGEKEFSLTLDEVSVACASHNGEPRQIEAVASLLSKGGFTQADLHCGAQIPYSASAAAALAHRGEAASPLHNNCSGKHAAMLLACRLLGFDPATYEEPVHPLQRCIREKIAFYGMFPNEKIEIGVDGCSVPVFRAPISRLAAAYSRLAASCELPGETARQASARRRVAEAMTLRPYYISGSGEFTTRLIESGCGRRIGKDGAEGVYAMAVAGPPVMGIAIKVEDGSSRARYAVSLDTLKKIGEFPAGVPQELSPDERPRVFNARGFPVGEIVADVPLERAS